MPDHNRPGGRNAMNPSYDPRSVAIDTFKLQMMDTDPRAFMEHSVELANNLKRQREERERDAAAVAGQQLRCQLDPHAEELAQQLSRPPSYDGMVIPHQYTFASLYNSYKQFYYYYFDEALRNNYQNALAMRRDGMIQELLRHRQLPTVSLDFHIVPDDPDDKAQQDVAKQVTKVVERTARFQSLKLWLLEWIFYGKSGVQFRWGKEMVDGTDKWCINGFSPIQGDKIVYKWDGTPGVLIYPGNGFLERDDVRPYVDYTTIGPTFFLYKKEYRDRFMIGQFEASDFDYLFEPEKAAATHGIGLRDRFYWTWNMYTEILSWQLDAMQRVGANGMLYAFYQANNPQSRDDTLAALKLLVKENVSAFPVPPEGMGVAADTIQHIEPSTVGYDVMYQMMQWLAGIMRRGFLGQNLSSDSAPTGLGSGMSELHADMFENIVIYDSKCLEEVQNKQQLKPTIDYNIWKYKGQRLRGDQLPFGMQYKIQMDRENVQELVDSAEKLHNMGVPLDMEDLRDKAGLSAPKNVSTAIAIPGGEDGTATNRQALRTLGMTPGGNGNGNGKPTNGTANGNGNGKAEKRLPSQGANGKAANANGNGAPAQFSSSSGSPSHGAEGTSDSGTVEIRLTFRPRVREGTSLFGEQREWWIGDDDRPKILLRPAIDGRVALEVYDPATETDATRRIYATGELEAALRAARGLAQAVADMRTEVETVTVDDLTTFNHQLFHKLHEEQYDVFAKIVGDPAMEVGPGVDCWQHVLTNVHGDSERAPTTEPAEVRSLLDEDADAQPVPRGDSDPGVMIALMIPTGSLAHRIGTRLADPDLRSDLHITLAYLGRLSTLDTATIDDATAVVSQIAEAYAPLAGTLKGIGRFPATANSDGRDVLYWTPDIAGIGEFRGELCEMLTLAGVPYSNNFGFRPHVTLAYVEPGSRVPARLLGIESCPVEFATLAIVVGGNVRQFPFGDGLNLHPEWYGELMQAGSNGHSE